MKRFEHWSGVSHLRRIPSRLTKQVSKQVSLLLILFFTILSVVEIRSTIMSVEASSPLLLM